MASEPSRPRPVIIWGSELSPFALKLQALYAYAQLPYRWLPADGGRLENLRANWQMHRAQQTRSVIHYPQATALDEYPLVPYLIDGDDVYYDSSALARWLDDRHPGPRAPLFPSDPTVRFVAQLIDEAFDEIGLYMVHHNRWVLSAATNDAGSRLAREFQRVFPPGMAVFVGPRFARRQTRRLPYLFSVAPAGFSMPGQPPELTPPSRPGFPPTHALLDELWRRVLAVLEELLGKQPFVLGGQFTVADASIYGQLAMNLSDLSAAQELQRRAPRVWSWLQSIHAAAAPASATSGGRLGTVPPCDFGPHAPVALSPNLQPLLAFIADAFVPLMQQNEAAYESLRASGETSFNEPAFNAGRALYDGVLCAHPFRAVVKTFQVRVWRELKQSWQELSAPQRQAVAAMTPDLVRLL